MFFQFDRFKNAKKPDVYLAKPNKQYICPLSVSDLKTSLCFHNISSGSFRVHRYKNGKEMPYYRQIQMGLYIEIQYVGWFQITDSNLYKENSGGEYMDVSFCSLETQLTQTYLTSFGSLGTEGDEQGGLDRYCLYNLNDQAHSIMHLFVQKNPSWKIGYIDKDISTQYRSFDEASITSYQLLTDKVSQVYECIFQFDSFEKTVSAYKLENIGTRTSIFLSERNLIKSVRFTSDDSDIKTVFKVSGGNDSRTNTPLSILEVNPSGNHYISNFSYYYPFMTKELVERLNAYSTAMDTAQENYENGLSVLGTMYTILNDTKSEAAELTETQSKYRNNMSIYLNHDEHKYQENYQRYESISAELIILNDRIAEYEAHMEQQMAFIQSHIINIQDFLGDDLYRELSVYVREQDFQDDSFIATTAMTDEEILQMQKELLSHARSELEKVCFPQFEMEVDAINFTVIHDFIKYTEQLELGNIITIELDRGQLMEARLLQMDINWDNPSDFTLRFSSKNSVDEKWALLAEIQQQVNSTGTSVNYNKGAWNVAKQTSIDFTRWMNGVLDTSLQKLQNSSNQEVLMDETGILLRRWMQEQNKYSSNQVWMTNGQIAFTRDSWKSVCTALGELTLPDGSTGYGICGEYLIGKIICGEKLQLLGSGAQLDLSANTAITTLETKNAQFTVNLDNFKSEYSQYTKNTEGTLSSMKTSINQNANNIQLKVDKNGIISAINLSSEGVRIAGNKITLDGEVTFSNTNKFGLDANKCVIDGGCITANTINAASIKTGSITAGQISSSYVYAGNISANQITSGSINSDRINTNTLTAKYVDCGNYFYASPSEVTIGGFKACTGSTGKYLMSNEGKQVGIGNSSHYCFWAGTDGADFKVAYSSGRLQVNIGANLRLYDTGIIRCEQVNIVNYPMTTYSQDGWSGVYTKDSSFRAMNLWADTNVYADGNITAKGNITADNNITAKGVGTAQSWVTTSDARLKKDITTLDDKFTNLILSINPVSYKFKEGNSVTHYGFTVQDLIKELANIGITEKVIYGDLPNGYYGMAYTELIAPMIKTIQSLNKRIEKLEETKNG